MEALAAAEASAAKRRPRLEVFHALSCAFDGSFILSPYGSDKEDLGNCKDD
jgi:hypothetical protein